MGYKSTQSTESFLLSEFVDEHLEEILVREEHMKH